MIQASDSFTFPSCADIVFYSSSSMLLVSLAKHPFGPIRFSCPEVPYPSPVWTDQVFQAISSPVLPGPSKDPHDHNDGTSGPIPPSVRAPPSSTAAGLASPTAMSCLLLTLTNLVGLLAVVGLWAAQAFCSSWGGTHSRRIADAVMLPSGAGSLLLMLGLCNLM